MIFGFICLKKSNTHTYRYVVIYVHNVYIHVKDLKLCAKLKSCNPEEENGIWSEGEVMKDSSLLPHEPWHCFHVWQLECLFKSLGVYYELKGEKEEKEEGGKWVGEKKGKKEKWKTMYKFSRAKAMRAEWMKLLEVNKASLARLCEKVEFWAELLK